MNKKYRVRLNEEERTELEALLHKGKTAAYRFKHAQILLQVDENGPGGDDEQTAEVVRCSPNTVRNVRQRYVEQGLKAALGRQRQARPSRLPRLDGEGQARLIQLACGTAPEGRGRWTLQLLADQLVLLQVVESISPQTVMRELKKTS